MRLSTLWNVTPTPTLHPHPTPPHPNPHPHPHRGSARLQMADRSDAAATIIRVRLPDLLVQNVVVIWAHQSSAKPSRHSWRLSFSCEQHFQHEKNPQFCLLICSGSRVMCQVGFIVRIQEQKVGRIQICSCLVLLTSSQMRSGANYTSLPELFSHIMYNFPTGQEMVVQDKCTSKEGFSHW